MSTLQRVKLADIQYVGSSAGSIYANPASTKTLVVGVRLFNGNTTVETVKLYFVPDSAGSLGTAGVGNQIDELSLQPKESLSVPFGDYGILLTDTNDSIQASTTTASKVTVVVIGDTIA